MIPALSDFPLMPELLPDRNFNPETFGLKWELLRGKENVTYRALETGKPPSVTDFSRALLSSGLATPAAIKLQGATVIHPVGLKILHRYYDLIRNHFSDYGIEEWDFPDTTSPEDFIPVEKGFGWENKFLEVSDGERAIAALNPTGEEMIYSFWSRQLNLPGNFPVKLFRKASYFRKPGRGKHSGLTLFKSMEARDIFEFHSTYIDPEQHAKDAAAQSEMLRTLFRKMNLRLLYSLRPPWTNNAKVSRWTKGADFILPSGLSLQVAALYQQDDIFSRLYGIGVKANRSFTFAKQITGYVSRRIVLARWFTGMRSDGSFFMDPDFVPSQLALITGNDETEFAETLRAALLKAGITAEHISAGKPEEIGKIFRKKNDEGVPLILLRIPGSRPGQEAKTVIYRNDTMCQAVIGTKTADSCTELILALLGDIRNFNSFLINQSWASACSTETRTGQGNAVRFFPLAFSEEAVRTAQQQLGGEVLGYFRSERTQTCAMTGAPTDLTAACCRRL